MFVECLVKDFFKTLKTKLMPQFSYLERDLWSPSISFEDRLLSYLVKEDVKQKLPEKNWIGFVWSFSGVQNPPSKFGTPKVMAYKDISLMEGSTYNVNFIDVNIQIGAFSNDGYEAINFMEQFCIACDRAIMIRVQYPGIFQTIGLFDQNLDGLQITEFTKLDRDTRGSLVMVGISFNATIPVLKLRDTSGLIGTEMTADGIKPKIYVNFEEEIRNGDSDNDGDSALLNAYYDSEIEPKFIII